MDSSSRRARRGRCHSHLQAQDHSFVPPQIQSWKSWKLLNGIYNFVLLSCLISVIYMMLDYQCATCSARGDLRNITENIDEISHHLVTMKNNYEELESQIFQFSRDLPKIEGQVQVLEALASSMDCGNFGREPKYLKCLPPNVDVHLNHCAGNGNQPKRPQPAYRPTNDLPDRNITKLSSNHFAKSHKVIQCTLIPTLVQFPYMSSTYKVKHR